MFINVLANKENKKEFMKMIAWIELCGDIGHTCQWLRIGVDGDGEGRLKFGFETKEEITEFTKIKQDLLREYDSTKKDLKEVSFE